MNPLLSRFPRMVTVRGTSYAIDWEARCALWLVQVSEDRSLMEYDRLMLMLSRFYPEAVPEDTEEATRLMMKFLNGGAEGADSDAEDTPPLFSYERDGTAIYTAILQRYGIDLESDSCHWWKLLAMMGDLDQDCFFVRLLRLRRGWLNGTLSKEEQEELLALGDAGLPPEPPLSAEEQEQAKRFFAELEGDE